MDTATLTRPARPEPGTDFISPATGRRYYIRENGTAVPVPDDLDYDYEGPTCTICDGLGHGYPGAGPCPLEDRGYDEPERF